MTFSFGLYFQFCVFCVSLNRKYHHAKRISISQFRLIHSMDLDILISHHMLDSKLSKYCRWCNHKQCTDISSPCCYFISLLIKKLHKDNAGQIHGNVWFYWKLLWLPISTAHIVSQGIVQLRHEWVALWITLLYFGEIRLDSELCRRTLQTFEPSRLEGLGLGYSYQVQDMNSNDQFNRIWH